METFAYSNTFMIHVRYDCASFHMYMRFEQKMLLIAVCLGYMYDNILRICNNYVYNTCTINIVLHALCFMTHVRYNCANTQFVYDACIIKLCLYPICLLDIYKKYARSDWFMILVQYNCADL